MTTTESTAIPVAPEEIARAVILPASYADMDGVVYPACRWLRENAPIARAELEGYDPVWLVSTAELLRHVLTDAETFHNADVNIMLQPQAGDDYLRDLLGGHTHVLDSNLSYMEPPVHTRHRASLAKAFSPGAVRRFNDRFREIARENCDRLFASAGQEIDIVQTLTSRYPLEAVLEMLGVPPEQYDVMLKLTQDTFGGDDSDWRRDDVPASPEAAAKQWLLAVQDAYDYCEDIRLGRQAEPRSDLASEIVQSVFEDGSPTPDRFQNHMILAVALAGHDTTNSAVSGGLLALIQHPDQLALAQSDPGLIPGLVDECLRWSTPARHFMRNASVDTTVGGVEIKAGERLMCLFVSGDRDEAMFPNADTFDITRRPNPHFAFSFGPHICLGQHIARIEMRALFEELIPRIGTIELAGEPVLKVANFVGGLKRLPVRVTEA